MSNIVPMQANLPEAAEARSMSPEAWHVLRTVLFTDASDEMILTMVDYCKARGLDPLKKPFHIVQVWDNRQRKFVEGIWPSIGEARITAMRTGQYAGMDEIAHGEVMTKTWGSGNDQLTVSFHEWAQCTVYRIVAGQRCQFVGPKVYWLEAVAKRKGAPNTMWAKRPFGQHDKCAEAAGLRAAFPEENMMPTAEEMEGQAIGFESAKDITPQAEPKPEPIRRATSKAAKKTAPPADLIDPMEGLGDELPPASEPHQGKGEGVVDAVKKASANGDEPKKKTFKDIVMEIANATTMEEVALFEDRFDQVRLQMKERQVNALNKAIDEARLRITEAGLKDQPSAADKYAEAIMAKGADLDDIAGQIDGDESLSPTDVTTLRGMIEDHACV